MLKEICETCGGCCEDCTEQEHCQRCRYEAAAPVMLAVLERIALDGRLAFEAGWCAELRAAIAKAKGE